jgi:hypothetical protein
VDPERPTLQDIGVDRAPISRLRRAGFVVHDVKRSLARLKEAGPAP